MTANALRRFHIAARRAGGDGLDEVRERAGLADVRGVRRYEAVAAEPSDTDAAESQSASTPSTMRTTRSQ